MSNDQSYNDITNKYNTATTNNDKANTPPLVFFNYHEYLSSQQHLPNNQISLVINHFPNFYSDQNSSTYTNTRIIRIPRCYNSISYSDLIPQFSLSYPGEEEGAIKREEPRIEEVIGVFDNNEFGVTSEVVGLDIDKVQLHDIISSINEQLYVAFNPFSSWNLVENLLNILTGCMFIEVLNLFGLYTHTKRTVRTLENYVQKVNENFQKQGIDLVIISPRKTGYLSVCISNEVQTALKKFILT
ncbi:ERF4 [Candida jiufengensis]|uniref:ERF4 n=1 Tax=Candida jiufengensis TaxID=497108 RepID=UPI0022252CFC|nr:ERF4 [Candida jiufengensis]KAI5956514.1 ERF4 [Candida jiufengensis]